MKTYGHVIQFILNDIWAIDLGKLQTIMTFLQARSDNNMVLLSNMEALAAIEAKARPEPQAPQGEAIAVLNLFGLISKRARGVNSMSEGGGTTMEDFTGQFRMAMADPEIGSVLLNIDSPGGSVFGVQELHQEILDARNKKRIVALANPSAASAAYFVGSAANEFYVTPSGEAGSIGVYTVHPDQSEKNSKEGVKFTYISAGKYKVEANPDSPLTEEAQSYLKSRVDQYYNMFTAAVAKGRGVKQDAVVNGFGEGRMLMAKDAVKVGIADGIRTYDQVLTDMISKTTRRRQITAQVAPSILQAANQQIEMTVNALLNEEEKNSQNKVNVVLHRLNPLTNEWYPMPQAALTVPTDDLDDEARIRRLAAFEENPDDVEGAANGRVLDQ